MDIEIIKNEKKELEVKFSGVDTSIVRLLVEKLNDEKDVEFAATKVEHPISGNQLLVIKTKKKEPLELVTKNLEILQKEVNEFSDNFKKK